VPREATPLAAASGSGRALNELGGVRRGHHAADRVFGRGRPFNGFRCLRTGSDSPCPGFCCYVGPHAVARSFDLPPTRRLHRALSPDGRPRRCRTVRSGRTRSSTMATGCSAAGTAIGCGRSPDVATSVRTGCRRSPMRSRCCRSPRRRSTARRWCAIRLASRTSTASAQRWPTGPRPRSSFTPGAGPLGAGDEDRTRRAYRRDVALFLSSLAIATPAELLPGRPQGGDRLGTFYARGRARGAGDDPAALLVRRVRALPSPDKEERSGLRRSSVAAGR